MRNFLNGFFAEISLAGECEIFLAQKKTDSSLDCSLKFNNETGLVKYWRYRNKLRLGRYIEVDRMASTEPDPNPDCKPNPETDPHRQHSP